LPHQIKRYDNHGLAEFPSDDSDSRYYDFIYSLPFYCLRRMLAGGTQQKNRKGKRGRQVQIKRKRPTKPYAIEKTMTARRAFF
jgi:hypothetical protein